MGSLSHDPDPYPQKPIPASTGKGWHGYGYGFGRVGRVVHGFTGVSRFPKDAVG